VCLGRAYGTTTIDGCKFGFCHSTYERGGAHGSDPTLIARWCSSGEFDYVLYGHVHYFNLKFPSDPCRTVLLNPGGFYYQNPRTIVILDITSQKVELYFCEPADNSFALASIIQLHTRRCESGPLWNKYVEAVIKMRRKRREYWKQNHYLCDQKEDWLKIDRFLSGERII